MFVFVFLFYFLFLKNNIKCLINIHNFFIYLLIYFFQFIVLNLPSLINKFYEIKKHIYNIVHAYSPFAFEINLEFHQKRGMGTFTITYTLQVDTISIREWHDYLRINGNASKLLRV